MSDYMGEIHRLSQLILDTLNAQKKYFKTRITDDLIARKKIEKELRDKADSYLEVDQL